MNWLRERNLVFLYCVMMCLTLGHSIYYGYSSYYVGIHNNHPGMSQSAYYGLHNTIPMDAEHPLFHGKDHAPDQYRIGVVYLEKFISDALSIRKYYIVFAAVDTICCLAVCWLLYQILVTSKFTTKLSESGRLLVVVLFLATLFFPIAWVVPWQRPETLPTALYLASIVIMLRRWRENRLWLIGILLATVWQGIVRADVPLAMGVGIILMSFMERKEEYASGWRMKTVGVGLCTCAIALTTQYFLKMVVYPQAIYPPDTKIIQFFANFHGRTFITFAVAMIPYFTILFLAKRRWRLLEAEDHLIVITSLIYLPLWWTLGIVGEVRIFVPFLLLLTPTAAKLLLLALQPAGREGVLPSNPSVLHQGY